MMKEKQVAALVVSIFGFYILWQAFAVGGLQALVFLFSLIGGGANKSIRIAALSFGVPIFLVLFILGIIFIRNAPGIGNWILRIRFRPLPDEEGDPLDVATFAQISHLAFSLLGLFLLVQTVPYALRDASHWMQVQFWSSAQINVMGHEERPSFFEALPNVFYHGVAIGLSLYIFLGKEKLAQLASQRHKTVSKAGTQKHV